MIDYHIDANASEDITKHLSNMNAVLEEVAVTYTILQKLLEEQDRVLSVPTINAQRQALHATVTAAIVTAETIADSTFALNQSSSRVTQRIAAIELDS